MLEPRPDDHADGESYEAFHNDASEVIPSRPSPGPEPALYPTGSPYPSTVQAPVPRVVSRQFFVRLAPPHVTYFLIGANIVMFVLTLIWGYTRYNTLDGSQNINVLVDMGAKVNEYIAVGEWWRLFSSMFLHIGVMHLLFNIYALYAIGTLVEAYYGHVRFAAIYLLGGLFGSLGSYAFSPSVSAGASGAIFAITGAAAVYFYRYRENLGARGRSVLQNMILVLVINFAFGLAGSGVDNWGHFGGLVGGVLVSIGLLPRYQAPTTWGESPQAMTVLHRPLREVGWTILVTLALVWGVSLTSSMHLQSMLP